MKLELAQVRYEASFKKLSCTLITPKWRALLLDYGNYISTKQKELLKNVNSNIETTSLPALQRSPSSIVLNTPVAGRDGEIRKIVGSLSRDYESSRTTNFHSVGIVGMPGVGKTTVAAHVFIADAMEQFYPKVWVSVSHNFNLERVTRAICRKVTSQPCDQNDFSEVQDDLNRAIAGKRFLIVLDDVWSTCDYESWTTMQSHFRVGAPGSKILVTTREEKVAKLIGATEVYNLKVLSGEECLNVFMQHINNHRPPNFDAVFAKKIVEKCNGLPLAAKTLGGILRCEEVDRWNEVLDDKLWSISNNESNILPVLKLSYHYLPSTLKRCFAYCSIFPNNYEFGKTQLILLWMAEGILQQPEGNNQMEDIGGNYFEELLSRSLFQKLSKSNSLYVMHDLVGDLARWASGDTYFRLEDKVDGKCSPKTRHSSYISGKFDGVTKFEKAFSEAKSLRTFLPLSISHGHENYLTCKVTFEKLPKLECLRVLSLNGYQISLLPESIGHLKHLRYLDLSHTLITSLPESTTTLYNLQTLILENCSQLKALPAKLKNLAKLRHLNNSCVPSLERMPPQLSQLTNYQTLSNFVVGKGNVSRVGEIGPLSLRWTLCLKRLENVTNVEDATSTTSALFRD
ncbi:putative P-loop containing nucleoside triphosphate hydrolase, leucine-rich repeat domain, L [Rosa chinensis]|uniref:Putative P-loop containing nucleoside triphosphate hydrolase, leucine-rich repeat domain, L n=1 Tax=Rosa chinensis TaxID=74649 RepID=A0A2P6S8S2_ROSCH|nr:putative P-loop containing nucleoside triphosphate hydrolase, leucine-rich repeat domain, L [Rosa chinensis]